MVIDDGVSGRDNRLRLFDSSLLATGIFSGTHSANGHQSCIVLGADYTPDINEKQEVL
jgi:hypothetical protein